MNKNKLTWIKRITRLVVPLFLLGITSCNRSEYPNLNFNDLKWHTQRDYRWEIRPEMISNLDSIAESVFSEMAPKRKDQKPRSNSICYKLTKDDEDSKRYVAENDNFHEYEILEIEFIRNWVADSSEIKEKVKARDAKTNEEVEYEEVKKVANPIYTTSQKRKFIYDWETRRISEENLLNVLSKQSFHGVSTAGCQQDPIKIPWFNLDIYDKGNYQTNNYSKSYEIKMD